ncbi:MAG: alpha/beta fold hydrolase [Acidimicrobiales bacterium]
MPPPPPSRPPAPARSRTDDGVDLAIYDLGGTGPDLLLVHATGFCAEVFVPLVRSLSTSFSCWGVDLRGHGRSGRPPGGTYDWSGFAIDVLTAVGSAGLDRPYGFGHSCGGAALLLAEARSPGVFRSLYCFEPVVFPVAEGSRLSVTEDNPLSRGALRRRESFSSAEEAFWSFASKPPFADLDPEALWWYVQSGFEVVPGDEGGDGQTVRLRCRRADEAAVYAQATASTAFTDLARVACPVRLACGQFTDSFGPSVLEADAARLRRSSVEIIRDVGHFGPLQAPEAIAASVVEAFEHEGDAPSP